MTTLNRIILLIAGISFFIISFIFLKTQIANNKVSFQTDEVYWISTSRLIPLIIKKDWTNSFWNEHWGFTNFNGAKIIYGTALTLMGHNEEEILQTGSAPNTYYNWIDFEEMVTFPQNHSFYNILRDARTVSALFTSLSAILFLVFLYQLFSSLIISVLGTMFFITHPLIIHIGTHSLSDSFFMFFEIVILLILNTLLTKYSFVLILVLGFATAFLTSIKVNGIMFAPIIVLIYFLYNKKDRPKNKTQKNKYLNNVSFQFLVPFFTSFLISFLFLHPNFYFYPPYTPMEMIQNRIKITQHHINYFSTINPDHVILNIQDKLISFAKHIFTLWLIPFFIIGLIYLLLSCFKKHDLIKFRISLFILTGFITFLTIISYVVFDEGRYYLPIVPFVILISVYWINPLIRMLKD